jgi:hydroxymethylglutaryl-CoA synthase
MNDTAPGISGLSVYLPPYRVDLKSWCEWTGTAPEKITQVVGSGFRLTGPGQSVYTMAANAVIRLIQQYDIDTSRVRYLALGTESSTDNSAGAIIIKGMVDSALREQGRPPLSRNCEVPEFKHACLGGIYGLKNALRFLAADGSEDLAIVVCADKALYARGSSGEPTQGAGAVAMLLEANPTIATANLAEAGTASDYRGVDFRKPLINRNGTAASVDFVDIPVFNGKYSTGCYVDEMQRALEDMYTRRRISGADCLRQLDAVFMHRPYHRMPETGWSMAYLFALAQGTAEDQAELAGYCEDAEIPVDAVLAELRGCPQLAEFGVREKICDEVFPLAGKVMRKFRGTEHFQRVVADKMQLGSDCMKELGNLYTGALPAWLAAGLADAADSGVELAGRELLLLGYGSGDAADAIPLHVLPGWQAAANRIRLREALQPSIDLSHDQYLALRDHGKAGDLLYQPRGEFVIDRVDCDANPKFSDAGIEYYRYVQ